VRTSIYSRGEGASLRTPLRGGGTFAGTPGVGAPLQAPPGWEHPCGHPRVGTDTEVPVPGFGQKLVLTLRPAFPILLRLAVLSSVGWAGFGRHRKHTENIHKILSVPGLELTHYYTIAQRLNHYTTVPPYYYYYYYY